MFLRPNQRRERSHTSVGESERGFQLGSKRSHRDQPLLRDCQLGPSRNLQPVPYYNLQGKGNGGRQKTAVM